MIFAALDSATSGQPKKIADYLAGSNENKA
jgi:hypothetical protein